MHAIEPTAMEHGRIVGRQYGRATAGLSGQLADEYRGSAGPGNRQFWRLGEPDGATSSSALKPERPAYRKLLWQGDRLIGAMILGPDERYLDHQRRGDAQRAGAVRDAPGRLERPTYSSIRLTSKRRFMASGTTARLLPQTVLGRASVPAGA